MRHLIQSLVGGLALFSLSSALATAQVVTAPLVPQLGSSNPASIDPPITRPSTTPCTVPLLSEEEFANYVNKSFSFTPPAACPGPWAKVVFSADFTVTAGRQYDRTAKFFLGGANIYFGTTAEPRSALSPSWHVERDVTDLSALFHIKQVGNAELGNFVGIYNNVNYNGIIYANARLQFYPADASNPAPVVPSAAIGFPFNDSHFVNTTTDVSQYSRTYPRNLERLYLDVIPQSQSTDEFWYTNVPTDLSSELEEYGNTAFREVEVRIDGKPAGVAPVYPWIYTGGIDPYLWEPIPGIETLDLKPYRVDLTPFVGTLTDGKRHTIDVSVFNADSGFDVASTLLLFNGPSDSVTTGALLSDDLAAEPSPTVTTALSTTNGTITGPVTVHSSRNWRIAGYINTSHGRVDTSITGTNFFNNTQQFQISNSVYVQDVDQQSLQKETIATTTNTGTITTLHSVSFPLQVNYSQMPDSSGNYAITTTVAQGRVNTLQSPLGASSPDPIITNERIASSDTLHYNADFTTFLGHDGDRASATYGMRYMDQTCLFRKLTSVGVTLSTFEENNSCALVPLP